MMGNGREVILITGASGRIGFKAAERFSKKYRVVGFDVQLIGSLPDVEFVGVDMASDKSISDGMDYVRKKYGSKLAGVVHLAAYYSFARRFSSSYDKITVQGTQKLLKQLQSFDCEQFIFSSTMLVQKPTAPGIRVTEESPLQGTWGYPISKIQTEEMIAKERGKIPAVNLRIAGVYDDECHSIPLSNQMQRIIENQLESHLFAGDPSHGASFVHMDDLIDAIFLCFEKRKQLPPLTTFLIGEELTMSYDAIQKLMGRLIHKKEWKTFSVPKPIAKVGAWFQQHLPFMKPSFIQPWMVDIADDHFELDISKAKQLLGWTPKHRVDQEIPKWVEQLKRDPIMWYDENKLKAPRGLVQYINNLPK